MPTQIKWGG